MMYHVCRCFVRKITRQGLLFIFSTCIIFSQFIDQVLKVIFLAVIDFKFEQCARKNA